MSIYILNAEQTENMQMCMTTENVYLTVRQKEHNTDYGWLPVAICKPCTSVLGIRNGFIRWEGFVTRVTF